MYALNPSSTAQMVWCKQHGYYGIALVLVVITVAAQGRVQLVSVLHL